MPKRPIVISNDDPLRRAAPVDIDRILTAAAAEFGVVRISDVTRLDELGLPTVTVVRRDPIGESVSVASGQGPSSLLARVAALAEALERYCAEPRGRLSAHPARCNELPGRYLDPERLVLPSPFDRDVPVDWCLGTTAGDESIWIPVNAVTFPYVPTPGCRRLFAASTHGLAVGSDRTEAVVHGLLECIERDAYSRAVALASIGRGDEVPVISTDVLATVAPEPLAALTSAGVQVLARDLTNDTGVPAVSCAIADGGLIHLGVAAHPSPVRAIQRAIREATQSRLVDLQGAREDLPPRDGPPVDAWFTSPGRAPTAVIDDAPPRVGLAATYARLIGNLRSLGVEPIVVDLGLASIPLCVVRVVTPGLEVWAFDADRIGPRAQAWLSSPR